MTDELLNGFSVGAYKVLPREEKIEGPGTSHHVTNPKRKRTLAVGLTAALVAVIAVVVVGRIWLPSASADITLAVMPLSVSWEQGRLTSGPKTQYIEFLWARETGILRRDPRFPALLESANLVSVVDLPRSDR